MMPSDMSDNDKKDKMQHDLNSGFFNSTDDNYKGFKNNIDTRKELKTESNDTKNHGESSTQLFSDLMNSSDESIEEAKNARQDTNDKTTIDTSKSRRSSSIERSESIPQLFEHIKSLSPQYCEEREAPKNAEDYQKALLNERLLLEKTSFNQKYHDKLELAYDFTEIKWGSPIKTVDLTLEEKEDKKFPQSPSTSKAMDEPKFSYSSLASQDFFNSHERASKRKAIYDIQAYAEMENKSENKDKDNVYDYDEELEEIEFDKNVNSTKKKRRGNTRKTTPKGPAKKNDKQRKLFGSKKANETVDIKMEFEELEKESKDDKKDDAAHVNSDDDFSMFDKSISKTKSSQRLSLSVETLKKLNETEENARKMEMIDIQIKLQADQEKKNEMINKRLLERESEQEKEAQREKEQQYREESWRIHLNNEKRLTKNLNKPFQQQEPMTQCPVCDCSFPASIIEAHASECDKYTGKP